MSLSRALVAAAGTTVAVATDNREGRKSHAIGS